MSPKVREWAKRQRTGLGTRKLVLMVLADYADDDGRAIVSTRQLREVTELSERGVETTLRHLERSGLAVRELRKGEDGRWITNRYALQI